MVTGAGGGAGDGATPDVMNLPLPWGVLGLRPTADTQLVRRAYAALIRQFRPDSHPREFARVRQAYELAQEQASYFSQYEADEPDGHETDEADGRDAEAEKEPASQPDPAPAPLPVEGSFPVSSPEQPAVFVPLASWDVAADPGTAAEPEPVGVTQPGDLPGPETAAPWVYPAPQPVPVPLGAGGDEEEDEADAFVTRPGLLPDWSAMSSFDATAQVQALIYDWNVNGEQSALSLLRQQLVLASQATMDASMDYQEQLLQWLLTSDAPPLALVFEGERLLRWSENRHDIRLQLGDHVAQRLALLIQLAQEYVFGSRFSSNAWERRLFVVPPRPVPWLAFTAAIQDARLRLQQWRVHCEQAGLPALLERLNPTAVRRMDGAVIYSSDIFLGLLPVLIKADDGAFSGDNRVGHLLLAALAVVLLVAACVGWRWLIRLPASRRLWQRGKHYWQDIGGGAIAVGISMLSLLAIFGLTQDAIQLLRMVAGVFLSVVGLCLFVAFLSGWWWLLLFLEALLLNIWHRPLDAMARLGFRHLLPSDTSGWVAPSWRQRLRLLPGAVSAAWQQRKQRQKSAGSSKKTGMPRWVYWLGGFVLLKALLNFF